MISILLGLKGDQKDLERIKMIFKTIDEDSNGSVTKQEILKIDKKHKLTEQSHWGKILRNLDLEANGRVDFHDFFTAAVDHNKYLTKQNIDYMFTTFDLNGDGKLDLDEFNFVVPSDRWGKILA